MYKSELDIELRAVETPERDGLKYKVALCSYNQGPVKVRLTKMYRRHTGEFSLTRADSSYSPQLWKDIQEATMKLFQE